MPTNKGKPSQKDMREQIQERLLSAPELSDRAIARSLNCSPTTVGTIRAKFVQANQIGQSDTYDRRWLSHPYLLAHPEIVDNNLSKRGLRALRHDGVLDRMAADNLTSAVYAERLMHKEARAKLKSPLSGLKADDYMVFTADIHKGLDMISDKSITHIVTDPPYKRDDLIPLLDSLGKVANRVLTDDGVLLCMVGGSWLPDAMRVLERHLRHWWQIAYLADRASPPLQQRSVSTHVKWVLMYVKKEQRYIGPLFSDLIKPPPAVDGECEQHEKGWAQSIEGFEALLRKFINPSEHIVLDPMCGSGVTLLACARLGIKAIGCDISERCRKTTRRRIDEEFATQAASQPPQDDCKDADA